MSKKKEVNPANTKKASPIRDEKGRWVKGCATPNPAGRPKDGESWSGIIREISEMTVEDVVNLIGKNNDLGRSFAQMPKNVQMKKLITARVMASLMFEPTSGLWNSLMERAEGKVPDRLDVTSKDEKILDDSQLDRAMSTLADAIGKIVPGQSSEQES
jgi:hypothetical protein